MNFKKLKKGLSIQFINENNSATYCICRKGTPFTYGDILVSQSPFFNCQTYTIGGVDELLGHYEGLELETFILIQSLCNKPQLLIDINMENYDQLISVKGIKDNISFKNEYTSSNSSEMCLIMINTAFLNKMLQDSSNEINSIHKIVKYDG